PVPRGMPLKCRNGFAESLTFRSQFTQNVGYIHHEANNPCARTYGFLNCRLSILSDLILESRVDCGMPSLAAAPDGPDTLPLLSVSAASISCLSWAASLSASGKSGVAVGEAACPATQLSSTEKLSELQTITDRSITFCSSRILPGHE